MTPEEEEAREERAHWIMLGLWVAVVVALGGLLLIGGDAAQEIIETRLPVSR